MTTTDPPIDPPIDPPASFASPGVPICQECGCPFFTNLQHNETKQWKFVCYECAAEYDGETVAMIP